MPIFALLLSYRCNGLVCSIRYKKGKAASGIMLRGSGSNVGVGK
jgi:hypothetical protein